MKAFLRWPLTAIIASALAIPTMAQQASLPAPASVVVNMRDVDIADVAQQVSRITGRTIILDPSVQGTVTVTSATPLPPAGVWELFVSVLRGQGYAIVRNGRAWRVAPQAAAVREPAGGAVSAQVVTRLIPLRNVSPEAAARIFRPLVGSFGSIEPLTEPNAIVVTDYSDNIARIAALARSLDSGGGSGADFQAITLRYASASEVAAAIREIIGGEAGQGPRAVADERSNIVLVRGDPRALTEARRIAETLDRPSGAAPVVRVFRLRYNDAEAITDILRGLMGAEQPANNPVARTLGGSLGAIGGTAFDPDVNLMRERAVAERGLPSLAENPAVGLRERPSDTVTGLSAPAQANGFTTDTISIQAAPDLNAIVVRGVPSAVSAVETLIVELDVRRPQVMIEAAIVEVTGDQAEQLGIQLGLGAAADAVTNSLGTSFSNLGLSLRQVLSFIGAPAAAGLANDGLTANFGSRGDFALLVQALAQSTRANLLSTPSITTLDNAPAEIVVGQNVPFRTGSFVSEGFTTTPFTTIQRADVGITLRVVPRIHEGDTVRLEVDQEVSSLVGSLAGAADLITNRRSIQTTVLADDGQTIVLGGLISDDQIRVESQVPVLGDIPIVGELFKSRRNSTSRRTLFVFLRPTILRDTASVATAAEAKYNRLRGAEADLQEDESLLLNPPKARLPAEVEGIY